MSTIGYRISKARSALGMNQKELSQKAKIPEASLSRYENDIREPKSASLKSLAKALEVSSDYLLGIHEKIDIKGLSINSESAVDVERVVDVIAEIFEGKRVFYKNRLLSKKELDEILFVMDFSVRFALEKQRNKK